ALAPRLAVDGDRVEIYFESPVAQDASAAPGRAGADAVLRAWREGDGLVPLDGGGWAPVPAEWLARHGHLVTDVLAARDDSHRVPVFALPDLARLCEDLDHPPPSGLDTLAPLFREFTTLPE